MTPTSIVAYLCLLAGAGFLFLFGTLLLGRFLRAQAPTPEKLETYECGEPSVGSSYVQFDLRFYVIALVFIIFDVEVAFFFPWANVFGKATQVVGLTQTTQIASDQQPALTGTIQEHCRELGMTGAVPVTTPAEAAAVETTARQIARIAMIDMAVFFAVLMLGFAYVWSQGDLDWVRAMGSGSAAVAPRPAEAPVAAAAGSGASPRMRG